MAGGAAGADAVDPAAGAGDGTTAAGVGGSDASGGGGGSPVAAGSAEHADLVGPLGELTTKIEERLTQGFQRQALADAREDYGPYFDALETHPYMLTGRSVPAIGKDGEVTLRSTEEAKEYLEALRHVMAEEIADRVSRQVDSQKQTLDTLHASVSLFQNNADLLPGTKTFDRELADRFAQLAKPYELRVEGKLLGYTIPVQPLVDSVRAQLGEARKAAPASAAAPAQPATGGKAKPQADPPQAGIASKAGASAEGAEDFSTLFGTLGLPDFRI